MKRSRPSLSAPIGTTRTATPRLLSPSIVRVSAATSSGAVCRSLTSTIEPFSTCSRSSIRPASSSASEMRVPPRKLCVHGVGGSPRSGGVSTLSTGSSSLAGVPGGSSS